MENGSLEKLLGGGEKVLLSTQEHWFGLVRAVGLEVGIMVVVAGAVSVAMALIPAAPPAAALGYLLILLPVGMMVYDILKWSGLRYVLTNRRVIRIAGVGKKSVTGASLEKIEDAKVTQSALGRLLGYGDVEILAGSEVGVGRVRRVGDPNGFKSAVLRAKDDLEGERAGEYEGGEIAGAIENLEDLRRKGILSDEAFERSKEELLARLGRRITDSA